MCIVSLKCTTTSWIRTSLHVERIVAYDTLFLAFAVILYSRFGGVIFLHRNNDVCVRTEMHELRFCIWSVWFSASIKWSFYFDGNLCMFPFCRIGVALYEYMQLKKTLNSLVNTDAIDINTKYPDYIYIKYHIYRESMQRRKHEELADKVCDSLCHRHHLISIWLQFFCFFFIWFWNWTK